MLNINKSKHTKKFSLLILIIMLIFPSFFTSVIGKNADYNNPNSINNIGSPSYHYSDINVKDDFVYLSTFGNSWEIWDASDPKKPFLVKKILYGLGDSGYVYDEAFDMEIINDYLFISFLDKITIYDLVDPTNPINITTFSIPFSNIVEIHIENEFLYLLQYVEHENYTSTSALAILNISEFNSIQLLGVYNSSIQHTSMDWYHNYDRFSTKGDFAYLVCPGDSYPIEVDPVLEIIDISNKSNPQKKGEFVLPSQPYSIRLKDDFAFIPTRYDCLQIIDCSSPSAPINISEFASNELIQDIKFDNNVGYLLLSNKLVVLDITDFENVISLGEYTIRNQGNTYFHYLHLHGDIVYTIGPSEHVDRYFFIFDCSDVTNPIKLYPKGIRPSHEIILRLLAISTFAGIIVGPILLIFGFFFLIRKLKQRRMKAYQNEQKS